MKLLLLSGEYFDKDINICPDTSYTYDEIKEIFSSIKFEHHYKIVQYDEEIFTDLYDIMFDDDKTFTITEPYIVFLSFSKEDTNQIKTNARCDLTKLTLQKQFKLQQPDLHNDETFMIYCVNINPMILQYASDEIKSNTNVIKYAVYRNEYYSGRYDFEKYISDDVKDNDKFIKENQGMFKYSSHRLRNDENFVFNICPKQCYTLKFNKLESEKNIMFQKEYIIKYINHHHEMIKLRKYSHKYMYYIDIIDYFDDTEILNLLFELELQQLKMLLSNDIDIKNNINYGYLGYTEFMSDEHKSDRNIILKLIELENLRKQYCIKHYKYYTCSNSYEFYEDTIKNDIEIINKCAKIDLATLKYIPKEMEKSKQIKVSKQMAKDALQNYDNIKLYDEYYESEHLENHLFVFEYLYKHKLLTIK